MSYIDSHSLEGYGNRYKRNYQYGYYAALFRDVEAPLLHDLFRRLHCSRGEVLDFACGTGRISELLRMNFDSVIGVDVSDPMLEVARRDVPGVIFLKQDIIRRPIEQNFDVITAFRFFLNAEDDLRKSALNSLYRCLRTDGVLILNIHMNSSSIMGVLYRGLNFALGREVHKTCGIHEIERLLSESGFKVKEVIWYGLMPRPGHYFPGLMEWLVLRVERLFGRLGLVGRFAQSFVVVACRRD